MSYTTQAAQMAPTAAMLQQKAKSSPDLTRRKICRFEILPAENGGYVISLFSRNEYDGPPVLWIAANEEEIGKAVLSALAADRLGV